MFLTFTYAPDCLPSGGNLQYKDFSSMIKNVRNCLSQRKIKFFVCGEYGTKSKRPHYHAIIFGVTPAEAVRLFKERNLWPYGYVDIGYSVSDRSIGYISGYCVKKVMAPPPVGCVKPFNMCSKGIGKRYCQEHTQVLVSMGCIKYAKATFGIPRYYFKVLEIDRGEFYKEFINKEAQELVGRAKLEHISVFHPCDCNGDLIIDNPLFNLMRAKRIKEGRIIHLDGKVRYITEMFYKWLWSLRMQEELNRRARFKRKENADV